MNENESRTGKENRVKSQSTRESRVFRNKQRANPKFGDSKSYLRDDREREGGGERERERTNATDVH